jgi:excisionase family DNA binding protein
MTEKLLTPDAVAKMLEVSPATVRIWLRNGTLRGLKVGAGRLWRISEGSVEEFLYRDQNLKPENNNNRAGE